MLHRDFVFVDIETTGSQKKHDRIIEVAAVHTRGDEVIDCFHTLVNPQMTIPHFIVGFTGISDDMVCNAPTFSEIKDALFHFLSEKIFVAHNVGFDFGFLQESFAREDLSFQAEKLCTVKLSRRLFPEYRKHNLDSLIERFSLECEHRHRALGDAEALVQFWNHIRTHFPLDHLQKTLSEWN